MVSKHLVPERLLSTSSFRQDAAAFLQLPPDILKVIAYIGDNPDGYLPTSQVQTLVERTGLESDQASDALAFAGYIYDRISDLQFSIDDALPYIEVLASELNVQLSPESLESLKAVFDYKEQYEKGRRAQDQADASGPQFLSISGNWRAQFHTTRTNDIAKVPVLGLTISWYHGAGAAKEFIVYLNDRDWENLQERIQELAEIRKMLVSELGS